MEPVETNPTVFEAPLPQDTLTHIEGVDSFVETKAADETKVAEKAEKTESTAAPESEKTFTNPQARARILEREKRELLQRQHDLEVKLDRVLAERKKEQEAPPAPEPEYDLEKNPVGAIMGELKSTKEELRSIKKDIADTQVVSEKEKLLGAVGKRMSEFREDPVLDGALQHIGRIMQRNVERAHPDLTHAERIELAKSKAQDMYIAWAKRGMDPVEETISMAVDYGYDADAVAPKEKDKGETKVAKKTPKEEISAERERLAATTSLGATDGKSPSKVNLSKLLDGTESDFAFKVRQMQQSGDIRKGRLGVPSFGDLARSSGLK